VLMCQHEHLRMRLNPTEGSMVGAENPLYLCSCANGLGRAVMLWRLFAI